MGYATRRRLVFNAQACEEHFIFKPQHLPKSIWNKFVQTLVVIQHSQFLFCSGVRSKHRRLHCYKQQILTSPSWAQDRDPVLRHWHLHPNPAIPKSHCCQEPLQPETWKRAVIPAGQCRAQQGSPYQPLRNHSHAYLEPFLPQRSGLGWVVKSELLCFPQCYDSSCDTQTRVQSIIMPWDKLWYCEINSCLQQAGLIYINYTSHSYNQINSRTNFR